MTVSRAVQDHRGCSGGSAQTRSVLGVLLSHEEKEKRGTRLRISSASRRACALPGSPCLLPKNPVLQPPTHGRAKEDQEAVAEQGVLCGLLSISSRLSHRRSPALLSKSRPLWHRTPTWLLAQDLAPEKLFTNQGEAAPPSSGHGPCLKPAGAAVPQTQSFSLCPDGQ